LLSYVSKHIKNLLADRPFEVMDSPGNSPYLNQFKHCWSYMKEKLKDKDNIDSIDKLINAMKVSVADPDRFGPDPDPTSENRPDSDPDPVKTRSGFI
jgi:hypothetical protein